ncbi:glycosyltransferase [Ornithinimicrobium sp. Y1847]|uniref:glycosyltransferase n=1 Tax=Ornithinimicrobium sp. Y1847 TaxID=3405419 RepID=UPI003CFEA180
MILLSAVIPFRNRDPLRLRAAIQSIAASTTVPHEIIVSDYGSDDPNIAEDVASEFDARVVYTQAGYWSRSASLNAGFAAAGGKVLLGADADIIWSPGAIDQTVQRILADDRHAVAFECQFMGPDITVDMVQERDHDWALYDRHSKLNPRWGVGMLFFPRFAFELVNGYEARMKTYGYEDNDFSNRIRAVGYPIHWVGARGLRAYHVWHERPGILAKTDPELAKEYDANRVLFLHDKSVVRNVVQGGVGAGPLVTVAIATRGRPELLETALASVLCQTVQDFEVVVVEDGPVDDRTRLVVESFGDERLKYVPQDWAGISAARNRALDMSTGRFTAVMDDDDIMPPWRLEASLGSIRAGEHGCVGSFVTFSDLSGELVSWQDPFPTLLGASMRGGFAGHPSGWCGPMFFVLFAMTNPSVLLWTTTWLCGWFVQASSSGTRGRSLMSGVCTRDR